MEKLQSSDTLEFLDELMNNSIKKVKDLQDELQIVIHDLFESFLDNFKQQFEEQKRLLKLIRSNELEGLMIQIKEQLKLKFDKLVNFADIIKKFQLSSNLTEQQTQSVNQIEITQSKNSNVPGLYKKIRKEKKEEECIKCPKCKNFFELIGDLRIHLNKAHNTCLSLKCPHCDVTLNDHRSLANHIFNSHGIEQCGQKGGKTIKYLSTFSNKIFYSKMLLSHEIRDNVNYHVYD